ncbi:MAG: methyltransferase domain-containing protein [Gammaproteobacteria bacterium]|nr:methyltransferase domain-containing protein [Gammaproteobacteria bacterium]MDH5801459.1 methyltransferase domain-containing protein [Gammaproteobacteria bacterium]
MEDEKRIQFIRQTFDTVCSNYGQGALRFFQTAAERLPGLLDLKGDEQVLDAAAGTGLATVQFAARVPKGGVRGIDLSEGMLQKARERAHSLKLENIEFQQMDMSRLDFPENHFDVINSSFGVFFVEDMQYLMRLLASRLKPGGRLLTTHFAAGSMSPMTEMIRDRLALYDVEVPTLSWTRVQNESLNGELYSSADLVNIRHKRSQVGYFFPDANAWWDVVWWAGYRGFVQQVPEQKLEQFKAEHLAEVGQLVTDEGIWFNVELIHTVGEKPL